MVRNQHFELFFGGNQLRLHRNPELMINRQKIRCEFRNRHCKGIALEYFHTNQIHTTHHPDLQVSAHSANSPSYESENDTGKNHHMYHDRNPYTLCAQYQPRFYGANLHTKVPPGRAALCVICCQVNVFPERSVYRIDYFNPNRGRYNVALRIGYLQPDFV